MKRSPTNRNANAGGGGPGTLMEWAIGKQYDDFRPNTGKLLPPGMNNYIFTAESAPVLPK
jgi:hypothetical protein